MWHNLTNERSEKFEGEILCRYQLARKFCKNKRVLDVGCGLGAGAEYIAKNGAKEVVGIDYSCPAISYAKKKFKLNNLSYKLMNVQELGWLKKRFEIILAFEIIEHLPKYFAETFVKQVSELLTPRGIVIVSTPNKLLTSSGREKPLNPYHNQEFTAVGLIKLFGKYFSNFKLFGIKCVNKKIIKHQKWVQENFKHKLITFISRFKITHEFLLPLIPQKIKSWVTGEDKLPAMKLTDFVLTKRGINKCNYLVLIARKNPAKVKECSCPGIPLNLDYHRSIKPEARKWNFLTKNIKPMNKKIKILDVGCGNGSILLQLKKMGFANLYGVEYERLMFTRTLIEHPDLRIK